MISADQYLKNKTDDYFDLDPQQAEFQKKEAFVGMELVKDTHRLALMNAILHSIEGRLEQGDTLSGNGKWMKNLDVILTNPPFGTKKLGKIEEAKQLIEEAKETFELRRESVLEKAFSGELTAKWRRENPITKEAKDIYNEIRDERIGIIDNKRELKEVSALFDEFDIGYNIDENNWIHLKANMFCENISCGSTPKKYNEPNDDVPFLKVYNIVNNKLDFHYRPQYIGHESH